MKPAVWYVKNVYKHFFCIRLCYVKLQKVSNSPFIKRFRIIIVEKCAVTYDIVKILSWYENMIVIWSEKLEYSVFAKIFMKRLSIFQRFFIVQNNDTERKRFYFIHYIQKVHMIWLFDRDFAKLKKNAWIDVDKCVFLVYNIQVWYADMAQLVEQLICWASDRCQRQMKGACEGKK